MLLILKEGVLKLRFFKSYFKSLPVTPSSRNILRSLGGFFSKIFPNEEEEGVSKPEAIVSDGQYWRHSPSSLITSLLSSPRQHENRHIHPHHSVLLVMVGVVY